MGKDLILKSWLTRLKQATYNTTFMYNLRMVIAFSGTAFVPYFLGHQLMTIPLTLGVLAAGLSDIDDRFSVRIMNSTVISLPNFICDWFNHFLYRLDFTRFTRPSLCHHFLWMLGGIRLLHARCASI